MAAAVTGMLTEANMEMLEKYKNDAQNKAMLENQQLGKDAFLKLMMTQLAHQDPLEPLNNEQMISQMAEFTSVEQMGMMTEASARQVEQNTQIIASLQSLIEKSDSGNSKSEIESLITKTDRTIELNEQILEELKKLNASKAQEAYE
ncbi:flagellar hook assembly protein FlgD [Acidaminobacter sp. JC074]|uniref:flagellar hook assembly protein FlgD n=1 Tax=Acidaminobacter sp. JC074 TaxID=2530199 RepID=UPI001F0FC1A3|nr:flagellar hook capping FlgD N-terminal domain-containing protein [Acidaminobacter sp. JC074]